MRMRGLQCELKFQILPNIIRVQNSTKTCTENLQKQEIKKNCICKKPKENKECRILSLSTMAYSVTYLYMCIYIQFKTTMILLLKQ